jgi:hypothetical protein
MCAWRVGVRTAGLGKQGPGEAAASAFGLFPPAPPLARRPLFSSQTCFASDVGKKKKLKKKV